MSILIQKRHTYTGNRNREMLGDSKRCVSTLWICLSKVAIYVGCRISKHAGFCGKLGPADAQSRIRLTVSKIAERAWAKVLLCFALCLALCVASTNASGF